jgi:hypothetical protein
MNYCGICNKPSETPICIECGNGKDRSRPCKFLSGTTCNNNTIYSLESISEEAGNEGTVINIQSTTRWYGETVTPLICSTCGQFT